MELGHINVLAIIVSWVLAMALGSLWYSKLGFAKTWKKLTGVDMMKIPKTEANRAIMLVAISSLLQVIALAIALNMFSVKSVGEGLIAGLFLWFGFTAITTIGSILYQRQSLKLWLLNSGFFFVVMGVNSLILTAWH